MPAPTPPELVACHDCDLLSPLPHLTEGQRARCPRCGSVLFERKGHSLDYSIALALTSLILFVLANVNILMRMNIGGRVQSGAIISGISELYAQGFWMLAALVLVVTILAPLAKILAILYVLAPIRFHLRAPGAIRVFRLFETLHPWAMTEVYMLGILVAMVKLKDLASLEAGVALYSFAALILVMAATDASLDDHEIWERLGHLRDKTA